MRSDTRNKRDYGRGYDRADANRDAKRGVHPAVIAIRMSVAERSHLRPGKKLSPSDVAAIRSSRVGGRRLARAFGVAPKVIWDIRAGRIWKEAAR